MKNDRVVVAGQEKASRGGFCLGVFREFLEPVTACQAFKECGRGFEE